MNITFSRRTLLLLLFFGLSSTNAIAAADLGPAIAQLRAVTNKDQPAAAQTAWKTLAAADIGQLTTILAGMKDATPVAENWLRSACDAVVERQLQPGGKLPVEELRAFALDTTQSPRARRSAYEWLVQAEPTTPDELLPKLLDDPSLDLRYDAVANLVSQAEKLEDNAKKIEVLQQALAASRNFAQINGIAEKLKKLEKPVDLTNHLGYVTKWHTIGPFDIAGGKGYGEVYPPEKKIELTAKHAGKDGEVSWSSFTSNGEMGEIDFIKTADKKATGVMYVYTTINSPADQAAEIRYESSNGTKIWLNGELVAENEVYHAGSAADQYVVSVKLKKGENTILAKVCQTERKEEWALVWNFRLRISDSLGGAIQLATNP